ncbi:hypothetical protein ACI65C_010168 [Semiaphis heraclei]
MNALATIFVVSATILSAARLARCQADQVDNKYLDPNDYFLAGGDLQDRRRILQDAFNRYSVQQQQQQENQQSRTGFDGIFQQRQQQPQPQQGFQRGGRKFTTDEPEQNFETSGRFTSRTDPRVSPVPTPPIQQGPLTLSNSNIRQLLQQLDVAGSQQCNLNVQAQWDFETNVNEGTQIRALEQQLLYSEFQRKVFSIMTRLNLDNVIDPNLRRQLKFLSMPGPAALPQEQLSRYNRLINDMLAVYNSASVCAFDEPLKCGLRLDPDLNMIMSRSRDWNELQHTWIEWRRRTGQKVRDMFEQLVDVSNQAALLNNVSDASEMWKFPYESPSFRFELEDAWEQIKPLYEQLHAYVRKKLRDLYGPERISREAPLPAHILGNMWGQSWENILDLTIPYPGKNYLDVTPQMIKQGYTPAAMFRVAEEFFISLNMSSMPQSFWANSVVEELPGQPIICQPSAWDFCNRQDYRIKMCTQVNMKDFITVHHEMAHVQYFLNYKKQPKVYRDGANPGFHEALSEAISLSVSTPKHLQTLGLILNSVDDIPHNINYLFGLAMDKLTFLPFSLALDLWRWDIFKGTTHKERYNCHWWDLRERLGGVKPPVLRSETDFDPGSKYHVPANIPYVGYYFGTVLQFQIHKAMCLASGQYRPNDPNKLLHKCDIYRSKEAGAIVKKIMESGSSENWRDTLSLAIGENRLDGSALREFFQPLEEWLRNENLRTGQFIGWNYDGDYCKHSIETANLQVYGGFYNGANSPVTSTLVLISLLSTLLICINGYLI